MKINHLTYQQPFEAVDKGVAVALGFFDGVHVAHQDLIQTTIKEAKKRNLASGIVTFYPKPSFVLSPAKEESYLTPLEIKAQVCEQLGIDYLFVIEFSTQVASLSHQQFVEEFLLPLNVKLVVAGDDNRYGKGGQGTVHTIGPDSNHLIEAIEFHERALDGVRVAASLIRRHLREGQIEPATQLLGRPYKVSGRVVYGKGRGKLIGVPTANIALKYPYLIPLGGVYLVRFAVNGHSNYGVCNIGYNPTFGAGSERTIEVHVLDFDGDLYDSLVDVEFFSRIRDEMKFASVDDLVAQIHRDISTAKTRILALQSS